MTNKCVDCGGSVAGGKSYLCESCWKKRLKKKLQEG